MNELLKEIDRADKLHLKVKRRNYRNLIAVRNIVCAVMNICPEQLSLDTNKREIADAKHIFLSLATERTTLSYGYIAAGVGRGHAMVNHSKKKCLTLRDPQFQQWIKDCNELLNNLQIFKPKE